jgi:hypothetical protein
MARRGVAQRIFLSSIFLSKKGGGGSERSIAQVFAPLEEIARL